MIRRIAGTHRELVHIDVGCVEQPALFGDGEDGERVGARLGGDCRAFERVERNVDRGRIVAAAADLFADEQHRRFVALAFANNDGAADRQFVERGAHRFDGGGIGGLFVAAPDQRRGRDRCSFGNADHFEDENAVEQLAGGYRGGGRHRKPFHGAER